jgi:Fe-Mn family superoxide dismutase
MKFELPELEYDYYSLEPYIDEETMITHHDKHHKAYTDKFNEALAKIPKIEFDNAEDYLINLDGMPEEVQAAIRNQGGGYVNHNFFWKVLKKGVEINGEILEAIKEKFGSFEDFKEEFSNAALGVFGSGWLWLVLDENKELEIIKTQNQDSPLTTGKIPILTIDVWEHAYYLKYKNKRAEYVENFFQVIDWERVNENYLYALENPI